MKRQRAEGKYLALVLVQPTLRGFDIYRSWNISGATGYQGAHGIQPSQSLKRQKLFLANLHKDVSILSYLLYLLLSAAQRTIVGRRLFSAKA